MPCMLLFVSYYYLLAGVPDVARDDQSQNLMDGIIFRYKEKVLQNNVEMCHCEIDAMLPTKGSTT